MLNEVLDIISKFLVIFSFSFLVALTGAMSPGPLLTYTIIKSVGTPKRGYLMGLWIIIGHALLEMFIIILLLSGFSFVLNNIIVVRIIGLTGGVILVFLGVSIIKDVWNGKIKTDFLDPKNMGYDSENNDVPFNKNLLDNPVAGGVLVSMSNPYWWVWWASIGLAFMIQFDLSFAKWPDLVAFFLGHEAGDLIWYMIVSSVSFFGLRYLNKKAYCGILVFCGLFMVLFGIFLGVSPFFHAVI